MLSLIRNLASFIESSWYTNRSSEVLHLCYDCDIAVECTRLSYHDGDKRCLYHLISIDAFPLRMEHVCGSYLQGVTKESQSEIPFNLERYGSSCDGRSGEIRRYLLW